MTSLFDRLEKTISYTNKEYIQILFGNTWEIQMFLTTGVYYFLDRDLGKAVVKALKGMRKLGRGTA